MGRFGDLGRYSGGVACAQVRCKFFVLWLSFALSWWWDEV
jgi:hypothetical protein